MTAQEPAEGWWSPNRSAGFVLWTSVATVMGSLIMQGLGVWVPWLNASASTPRWLILSVLGLLVWLAAALLLQMRRPRRIGGAYFAGYDWRRKEPYCMHCWEHGGKLVSVSRLDSDSTHEAYLCITHKKYQWPDEPQEPELPSAGGARSRVINGW